MSTVLADPEAPAAPPRGTPPPTRRRGMIPVLALCGFCAFLFLYGIGRGDLYRTESLRAILGAEMLRGGNWVVPTLYGEPILTKPPGMYAAIAFASWPAGRVTTVTARLPSVVAAAVAVFLFYRHFRRALGLRAALVAAAILPVSGMWPDRVPTAEIDMVQLAWVTAAVLAFLRALECAEEGQGRWKEALWWQAALVCVAGGVLTKWTAPAFFYATAVPLLWWRGRLRLLVGRGHLLGVATAAALCLGWAGAAVAMAGWDTFRDTVGREALQRLSPAHHPRDYPWGELLAFPLQFLAANLPWSAAALLTLRPSFARLWDERGRRLLQALLCWTWVNLAFWSVVPGHRPRHALPLQPGLAGLAALVCVAWLSGRLRWPLPRVPVRRVLVGVLAAWIVVKLAYVHAILPDRTRDRHTRATGERLAALVPAGETLYLSRLKDEGILFYYGRPARRLADFAALPRVGGPVYCLLTDDEWRAWPPGRGEVVESLRDEQGAPVVLVQASGGKQR